jgi:hypothetical protein
VALTFAPIYIRKLKEGKKNWKNKKKEYYETVRVGKLCKTPIV